jgi:hypothetical protein
VTRIQAYNETLWLNDLRTLAGLESSLGVSNILGIDIFNEPWDYTWADWSKLAGDAYTAINAVNPNILIFVEGTSDTANNQDGIAGNEVSQPYGTQLGRQPVLSRRQSPGYSQGPAGLLAARLRHFGVRQSGVRRPDCAGMRRPLRRCRRRREVPPRHALDNAAGARLGCPMGLSEGHGLRRRHRRIRRQHVLAGRQSQPARPEPLLVRH